MCPDIATSQCKRVLVVEDEDVIRETFGLALELEGYKVFTAANGKEALDLLSKIPAPCLILLDLMMPVMNGWEFIEAVQKDASLSTIPVVVVTAYGDQAKKIQAAGLLPI
jgi:CheY-like chemotaxis protein